MVAPPPHVPLTAPRSVRSLCPLCCRSAGSCWVCVCPSHPHPDHLGIGLARAPAPLPPHGHALGSGLLREGLLVCSLLPLCLRARPLGPRALQGPLSRLVYVREGRWVGFLVMVAELGGEATLMGTSSLLVAFHIPLTNVFSLKFTGGKATLWCADLWV